MKSLLLLTLLVFGTLSATIINVPSDSPTIQGGIDSASEGDTVLVADGTYFENLFVDKEITLGSYYIIDGDIAHRDNTIIDGSSSSLDDTFGSCVVFASSPVRNRDINPVMKGFTITNGKGTKVLKIMETPNGFEQVPQRFGGGVVSLNVYPKIQWNFFLNNGDKESTQEVNYGGGVVFVDDDGVEFDDDRFRVSDNRNNTREDSIVFSHNIFHGNWAESGKSVYIGGTITNVDMKDGYFDVYSSEDQAVSDCWIKTELSSFNFENGAGAAEAFTEDVFVSLFGSDLTGNGSEYFPFLTINYALEQVYGDSLNPVTIHVDEGTYSPSTNGEIFPLHMVGWVSLVGAGIELTLLDADLTDRVIMMEYVDGVSITNLTIKNGDTGFYIFDSVFGLGGGLYLFNSNPQLTDLLISNNMARGGGGISLFSSNPILTNVTINYNSTDMWGGGIYCDESSPILTNVMIWDNSSSSRGGGLYCRDSSNPTLENVVIAGNSGTYGGGIRCFFSSPTLVDVTITSNIAEDRGGGIFLTSSDPTLTNVTISGNEAGGLGTSGKGGGIFYEESNPIFTNVTISGNTASTAGGGIYCNESSTTLSNVTISDNSSSDGGGIYCASLGVNIVNSILWNDSPNEISGTATVTYSDIQGSWEGEGNIDADPLFVDPDNGDYHLTASSPCINAGDPSSPPDPDGTIADMGAYYFHQDGGVPTEIVIDYLSGWNLIGLPLEVEDASYNILYSESIEGTLYSYDGAYISESYFISGEGYWLRFNNAGSTTITGTTINELFISLSEGWNLVSGISETVSIYSISDPDSIIVSGTLYGYDGAYLPSEELMAGKGYWLRANNSGSIILISD